MKPPTFEELLKREEWRPALGYEGLYQVSSIGRVKRLGGTGGARLDKILARSTNNMGYFYLALCANGKQRKFLVHRLVAMAFIPNPENKAEVNHKQRPVKNCCVENLEWATPAENIRHATVVLKYKQGENNGFSVLKAHQIPAIRAACASGLTHAAVAKTYGVSPTTIRKIVHGAMWGHVPSILDGAAVPAVGRACQDSAN